MTEKKDWSIPDEKGNVEVPDFLMPLMNMVCMQIRLYSISGKSEMATIVHIVKNAHDFFIKHPELLK